MQRSSLRNHALSTCGGLLFAAGWMGLSVLLSGCNSPDEPAPITSNSSSAAVNGGDQCDELLDNVLHMVQPDRLDITAEREPAAGLLNQWLSACASSDVGEETQRPAAERLLERHLSPEALNGLRSLRFVSRDAAHLRDGVLFRTTAHLVPVSAASDLDRVVQLFDYVVRNIALVEPRADALPLTPYEIVLFGRGSAEDRAWVFANLLRQLRIDAVILRPREEAEEPSDGSQTHDPRWLVGVLLDDEVYLFDPRLGWPVPSARDEGDSPTVKQPATLSEVLEDDGLLEQFDLDRDRPYPLRADDLRTPRVELIGNSDFWTTRMRLLQASLSGARAVIVHDPLDDDETAPGLLTRVAEVGSDFWAEDDVTIWPHPERNLQGFSRLDADQSQRLLVRRHPFDATVPVRIDPQDGRLETGRPRKLQLKTRTAQILGDYADAVRSYQLIRIDGAFPPQLPVPPEIRRMHARAAEDALYWTGVSQFEKGDFRAAAETLSDYLRNYPSGAWTDPCRGLRALSLAEDGRFAAAIQMLNQVAEGDPQRDGYELLGRRWRRLRDEEAVGGQ